MQGHQASQARASCKQRSRELGRRVRRRAGRYNVGRVQARIVGREAGRAEAFRLGVIVRLFTSSAVHALAQIEAPKGLFYRAAVISGLSILPFGVLL